MAITQPQYALGQKYFRQVCAALNDSGFEANIFNEFLDTIYAEKDSLSSDIFAAEPTLPDLPVETAARFAAHIHYLSKKLGVPTPSWVYKEKYYLTEPVFDHNPKGKMKLVLLYESPMEYRQRNIFTNNHPLRRV